VPAGSGHAEAKRAKVVEAIFQNTLRAYAYAGKRSWSGPLASGNLAAVRKEIEALTLRIQHSHGTTGSAALARQLLGKGDSNEPF